MSFPIFESSKFKAPLINSRTFDKYEKINRIILIGNGFDLAHGLKSSFKDFIYDYSYNSIKTLLSESKFEDQLISIKTDTNFNNAIKELERLTQKDAFNQIVSLSKNTHSNIKFIWKSTFYKSIFNEIENKDWVDIEIKYFDHLKNKDILNNPEAIKKLNLEFEYIKSQFLEYLLKVTNNNQFSLNNDLLNQFNEVVKLIETRPNTIEDNKLPSSICILNFNYTNIAKEYSLKLKSSIYIPIHGQLGGDNIVTQEPVFGFGDEIDPEYLEFELLRNDEIFKHIKSFKYLQYSHYRNLIEFLESNPFQVQIFGHSCGLSDRTLLNSIFEHVNCISIKPFYFEKDSSNDYEQKSYAIARHFKSKSELRVKVVNKEYCQAMIQPINNSYQNL
jgi:hypothetical protein